MDANRMPVPNPATKPQTIHTFNDAWTEWLAGNKFPVAFFGDSTVDGSNTTGWVRNTLGTDNLSPNAFSRRLEELLREATGNANMRIYNAGFSGQTAKWAETVLDQEFGEGSAYSDVHMIGIGFGINDRLGYENEKAYREGFKRSVTNMIHWCFAKGIQPFLMTAQAVIEPGVLTQYAGTYPMRTSEHIETVANEVKRELAAEYGLQLVDLTRYTERFLQYSSVSVKQIISDKLHFGDIGHQYEAEVLFAHFSPRTIVVDGDAKIDYSSQKVFGCVPEDWVTMPDEPEWPFKLYVDHPKPDNADMSILAAWVFVNAKRKLTLKAFTGGSLHTYVKLNGATNRLDGAETVIGELDLGLHKLEVFSGPSDRADFKGFLLG